MIVRSIEHPSRISVNDKIIYLCDYSTRHIYRWNEFVIKIEVESMSQCRGEFHTWNKLDEKDRQYFAETFSLDYLWIKNRKVPFTIQEYIDIDHLYIDHDTNEWEETIERLARKYDLIDLRAFNVAIDKNNNMRIFDYGI